MGIDFPSSLSASAGQKFTYSGQEYEFNGTAWKKSRDKVVSFNGATGAIVGVTSVQGKTGDVTLTDLEITHGVETFNGLSGSIDTTSLILPVTGLSASGGITLSGDLSLGGKIITLADDTDLSMDFEGGRALVRFLNGQTIFNNTANDQNIRIKGSGDGQLFFTDAGNNRVGIGTETPTEKLDVNGTIKASGVTLAGGITFSDGTFQPTAARSGFRYTMVSSGSGIGTPNSGHMDIDKASEVDTLTINHTDKEGNDLKPLFEKLRDNGGYLEIMTGDFSQAAAIAIESQSGDDATVTSGETTIVVGSSITTVQAEFDIEQGLDSVSITDVYLRIVPNAANFIRSFNGITGSVDTSSLNLHVAGLSADGTINVLGISGPSAITFSNGEVIRNNPDGSIQIIPSDEGGNHFGVEIDATEWGFGPVINVIDESGTQVTKAIRLDTDITFSDTNVPDGSPARLMFGNASDRGFQQNNNNDGTVMFGVNGNNGHFAVGRKADLADGDRSMSTSDKTALGMTNPQFLVYSADSTNADDYIRLEHDQTDANIYSGIGGINLVPLNGAVGISGGGLNVGTNGITFGDDTTQKTATKDVGTFTISASSAISTGAKADALHRIPYNATLTKFEIKSKATGGFTAAVYIAGGDFGDPTTGFSTGATAETTGVTGATTTFGTSSVSEGDFVYLHVLANESGATAAQAFVSYETR